MYKIVRKSIIFIFLVLLSGISLFSNIYANSYSNNSISIDVNTEKRTYDYKDNVGLDIKIENKNRYAKLYYRIKEIYTGGGFSPLDLSFSFSVLDPLATSETTVSMKDNYANDKGTKTIDTHITFNNNYTPVTPDNRYKSTPSDGRATSGIGHGKARGKKIKEITVGEHAYEVPNDEIEDFKKFRKEKTPNERISKNETVKSEKEELENIKGTINATLLVIIIILLVVVILVIFIWFIIKSRQGGGFKYMSIVLVIGLLSLTIKDKTYAADTYQENVTYEKEVYTRCTYWDLDCSFKVTVEYYFVNTIAPITNLSLDTDSDNLPDYLEVLYLTDLNTADTDSDGIPDGDEVYHTFTDPLREDTDSNGTNDGDEDYDNDKLTNIEEYNNGTAYDNADTDNDSLTDYDEINGVKNKAGTKTYIMDPTLDDTDGDGLRDDIEIKLNLNPNDASDGNAKVSQTMSSECIPNKLSVDASTPISFKGEVKGIIDENVEVHIATDKFYDDLRGSVGEPIRIDTNYGSSDGLKVVYDLTKYKDKIKKIKLFRYDGGKLSIVNGQYISGNTIIGDVSSGEYVLVDTQILLQEVNLFIK